MPCSVAGANIECKFNFPCVEGILHRLSLRVEGGLKTDSLLLLYNEALMRIGIQPRSGLSLFEDGFETQMLSCYEFRV